MVKSGIVFLDAETVGNADFTNLAALGKLTVHASTDPAERIKNIAQNQVVVTNKVIIDRYIMDACPDIRLICIAATGMNNVDLAYAAEKAIHVKNVSGYSTDSVVQHTFAMALYMMEKLWYYDRFVKDGTYSAGKLFTHHGKPFHEIAGKNYGIIGLGTIGYKVARIAAGFGCNVFYYSTSRKNFNNEFNNVPLDMLLSVCDIISIHSPLNEYTKNLIGYKELCLMKNDALLINAGRGGIVNETDLARAINENRIGGAAVDVLEKEPPDAENPLLNLHVPSKIFITPHIAWASIESRERLINGICRNIQDFLNESGR